MMVRADGAADCYYSSLWVCYLHSEMKKKADGCCSCGWSSLSKSDPMYYSRCYC